MEPSSHERTSTSLLCRLGGNPNDASAWEQFVQRYGAKILSWCRHWGLQAADAEDVSQAVLLRVARQMRNFRYDPARSFRAWLKSIAHGAWCDWLDEQKRPGKGSGDSAVHERLLTVEARDDLAQMLEEEYDQELLEAAKVRVQLRVAPQTWQAFCLLALEGLSGAQAAERLSMQVGAVFVAKSKVLKMLKEEMHRLEAEGPP
jgi:RNA polymerase sigma-70 factor (ECF subfamily)